MILSGVAGKGSVLTTEGRVEMDAMVMDGQSLKFGSVCALAGVKNPCLLARFILDQVTLLPSLLYWALVALCCLGPALISTLANSLESVQTLTAIAQKYGSSTGKIWKRFYEFE